KWDAYVRCMVLGREHVLPMSYDPGQRRYIPDPGYLGKELEDRCVRDALTLCRALGYDMNTVEFAVKDGIPYAIDFMNPAPDMDINSLTPSYFDWVVDHMADLAIRLATAPRPVLATAEGAGPIIGAPPAPAPAPAPATAASAVSTAPASRITE
ncbi:MAG: hypothetical protein ACOVRP_14160, partial [Gemmatimonas sp.]